MSIPLDRLYNFLEDAVDHDIIIYRWYPHGSKNLENLLPLKNYDQPNKVYYSINPMVICHDQEPLDPTQYPKDQIINSLINRARSCDLEERKSYFKEYTLRSNWNLRAFLNYYNIYDYTILVHSEKNSKEVDFYSNLEFVPVYYWSHAIVANDWYRYAQYDSNLNSCNHQFDFLVYNRAWTGSREYRLKFAELVIEKQLYHRCKMGFSAVDSDCNYKSYRFKNEKFKITKFDLENYFFKNNASSDASADYVAADYQQCSIEVVLETIFDDARLHLTEKILRPIACGKPFILVSSPGALGYLRDYGFKTFNDLLDESYDSIQDPLLRLEAITDLMVKISNLPPNEKIKLYNNLQKICDYNKQRFFSKEFLKQVINEFKENLTNGIHQLKSNSKGTKFKEIVKFTFDNNEDLSADIDLKDFKKIKNYLRKLD